METPAPSRPVSELTRDLLTGTVGLLRGELTLARLEAAQSARHAVRRSSRIAVGGVAVWLGVQCLLAFAIIGIGVLLNDNYWLSALIVGLILAGGGGLLAAVSYRHLRNDTKLPSVRESLAEDRAMVEQKVYEIRDEVREAARIRRTSG